MKTNQEIVAEAQQLVVSGRLLLNEKRIAASRSSAVRESRELLSLPMSTAASGRARHVEATFVDGALGFRLTERETHLLTSDRSERDEESAIIASSDSAYDVLRLGYELAEEERLAAALERYVERSEDSGDPADGETVAEVEAIRETNLLSHADRLRTKAEAIEFLEGRLKPSALIAHAVERQCSRDGVETQTERNEMRLTIGEP